MTDIQDEGSLPGEDVQMEAGSEGRRRRSFTREYKAEVVGLCHAGGQTIAAVARDLGLSVETLRRWVQRARTDAGEGPPGALTTDERAELHRLRREVKTLQMEREILKKAAAFFAKETL